MSPLEYYWQAQQGSLSPEALAKLKQLAEAYPYFSIAHLAMAAQTSGANRAEAVARAAIYAHDRRRLAAYLEPQYAISPQESAPAATPEAKPSVSTPVSSSQTPESTPPPAASAPTPPLPKPTEEKTAATPAPASPSAPVDDRPQPRYVVKESKPKAASSISIARSSGETPASAPVAPPAPAATTPVAQASPAPAPTAAPPPPPAPMATSIAASPSPASPMGAVGQVDQKLQTVLNVRVGMYVPLAAALAKEVAAHKASAKPAAAPAASAPEAVAKPPAEDIAAPTPAPQAAAPDPAPPRPAPVPPQPVAAHPEAPMPLAKPELKPEPKPEVKQEAKALQKPAPTPITPPEGKPAEPRVSRPAAALTPPAAKSDDLSSKIQAMIAGRVADLDPASGPPVVRPPAAGPRPPEESTDASAATPPDPKAKFDPTDKLKAPWERRAGKDEAGQKPGTTLLSEPMDTGMDQLRRSLLSMIQTQISQPAGSAPTETKPPAQAPTPAPAAKDSAPPAPVAPKLTTPSAPVEARQSEQKPPAPAPSASTAPAPPPSTLDHLQAMIQQQVKPSEAPAPASAPEKRPGPVSPPALAAKAVDPAPPAPAPPKAGTPEGAKPTKESKEGVSLRGTSESMRRFVSPDFGPQGAAPVRTGTAPKPAPGGVPDPVVDPPQLSPASPQASAPDTPSALGSDPGIHGSTESFKRFVSPEFDESRRSEGRASSTGTDRPAALPLKDPAARPESASPSTPKAAPAGAVVNSMSRFVSPDFDTKSATLHVERPEGSKVAPPPLRPPADVPAAASPVPPSPGMQSDSFKRFVAPDFSAAPAEPAPAPAAQQPTQEVRPAAPAEVPVAGDSSPSFKRFVAPDFGPTETAAPMPAAAASAPAAPAHALPMSDTSETMQRFVTPDFGTDQFVARLESAQGEGADSIDQSPPIARTDTPAPAREQRTQPAHQDARSSDPSSEKTLQALERAFAKAQSGTDAPVSKPEPGRGTPSVAEALAAIQTTGEDQSATLGQVVADVNDISGGNMGDFSARIETFRENLAKLRQRTMPSPSEINLRTIQQKFLDRIVGAPRISDASKGGSQKSSRDGGEAASPAAKEKPEESEGERSRVSGGRSVGALVERFEAFAPKLAESMQHLRAQGKAPELPESETAAEEASGLATGSETLARILVQQGQVDRAVAMVEQLALKMPEKSAYFAALIAEWRGKAA